LIDLLTKVIQYLSVTSNSPFRFKGAALQKFVDLLKIVFRTSSEKTAHIERLKQCFKVSLLICALTTLQAPCIDCWDE